MWHLCQQTEMHSRITASIGEIKDEKKRKLSIYPDVSDSSDITQPYHELTSRFSCKIVCILTNCITMDVIARITHICTYPLHYK